MDAYSRDYDDDKYASGASVCVFLVIYLVYTNQPILLNTAWSDCRIADVKIKSEYKKNFLGVAIYPNMNCM